MYTQPLQNKPIAPFDWKDILKALALALVMVILAICLFGAAGCSSVKKSKSQTQEQTSKGRDSIYIHTTSTIYTDTGSITTYYRDSLIFRHDTVYQPIEKIIARYYKQDAKHDSFYIRQRDTVTVVKTVTVVDKKKFNVLNIWGLLFLIIAALLLLFRNKILSFLTNFLRF